MMLATINITKENFKYCQTSLGERGKKFEMDQIAEYFLKNCVCICLAKKMQSDVLN